MASVIGCSPDTLGDNYSSEMDKGRNEGTKSLRMMQMKVAMDGNVAMLIWLGKNRLEQSDKVEQKVDLSHEQEIKKLSELLLAAAKNPTKD
jgi:hypothetical protein